MRQHRCRIDARMLIEEDTHNGSGVAISADCKIGRHSVIWPNATIRMYRLIVCALVKPDN